MFHSFALNGTLQPFVKTDRVHRDPFPFNAIFIGNSSSTMLLDLGVSPGSPVFLRGDPDVEIDHLPWEV